MGVRLATTLPILLFLLSTPASAQRLFRTYSIGDGLTQSQVYALHQDSGGYLWVATLGGGVSRFDGSRFQNFTRSDGLAGDSVYAIAEDSDGALWFATDEGLSCYRGRSFKNFGVKDGLPDQATTALMFDDRGRLWIGTRRGLGRFENGVFSSFSSADGLVDDHVHSLAESHDGIVWVGTSRGISRLKCNGRNAACSFLPPNHDLPETTIHALLEDRTGGMWVGTYHGATRFDGERVAEFDVSDGLGSHEVRSILEDRSGQLWFGTGQGGVSIYDGATFKSLTTANGLGSDTVWALLEDREGMVWLGTYRGGISRYTGEQFVHYATENGLRDDAVRAILQDHRNDLWVGTIAGGVSRFDGTSFENFSVDDGLASDFVISILEDSSNRLWFGTFRGLSWYDGRVFKTFMGKHRPPGKVIRYLLEDRSGDIWIATNSAGLSRFDGKSFDTFTTSDGLGSDSVMTLYEDEDGRLWIGTGKGVTLYDSSGFHDVSAQMGVTSLVTSIIEGDSGDLWIATYGRGIVRYSKSADGVAKSDSFTGVDGLANDHVVSLIFDDSDNLWIGTEQGIDRLDIAAYKADGSKNFRHFGQDEGFFGIECISNAIVKDSAGFLWFGTTHGLTRVDPRVQSSKAVEPRVRLTNIRLFSEEIDGSRFGSTPTSLSKLPAGLELPHDKNHVTFDFESLSLVAPAGVRYRAMLEGFDGTWSPELSDPHAVYSKLPPGEYVFKVTAKNGDGKWSSHPATYRFAIRPPFWLTWWFYLLCLAGLVMMVSGTVWARTRSLREQRAFLKAQVRQHTQDLEREKAAVDAMNRDLEHARVDLETRVRERTAELENANQELRTEIRRREILEQELIRAQKAESLGVLAGGIAHDFNNLLTSVLGNISLAKTRVRFDSSATEVLTEAEKACGRTRDLTRQLQTFAKGGAPVDTKIVSASRLIEDTIRFAMMGSTSLCEVELPETLWFIDCDEGQISRVFHNVILNAQEAMPVGGVITIRGVNFVKDPDDGVALDGGRYVKISITDQGSGISEENLQRIFDPYFSSKEQGSGLGLALTYSIVKRHGGAISVDSKSGRGTTVSIYLPAGSDGPAEPSLEAMVVPGRGRVLVMDDDDMVRNVATEMLRDLGYEVEGAGDGRSAVDRYKAESDAGRPFDVVILDLTVPGGMGGLEAMRLLLRFDPAVRAVVSSGFSDDMVLAKYADYGFHSVLPKPYRIEEMSGVLGQVL